MIRRISGGEQNSVTSYYRPRAKTALPTAHFRPLFYVTLALATLAFGVFFGSVVSPIVWPASAALRHFLFG